MQAFLASPAVEGTVFEPLRDPAEFAKARIEMGAVQWPNGADLAPDAMYERDPPERRLDSGVIEA